MKIFGEFSRLSEIWKKRVEKIISEPKITKLSNIGLMSLRGLKQKERDELILFVESDGWQVVSAGKDPYRRLVNSNKEEVLVDDGEWVLMTERFGEKVEVK